MPRSRLPAERSRWTGVSFFSPTVLVSLSSIFFMIIYFLLIISIGRLEATASADGDIGRSSTMDQSKELDLCFSELHWSSFLDYAQKTVT